jgi:uncharacterized protein (TIGR02118 family)
LITLTALYPKTDDSTFDMDYYVNTHLPLVSERIGAVVSTSASAGTDFGGPTPYMCVGVINIESMDALATAFGAHGDEIMGDIPNFTNVAPVIYVGDVVS